MDNKKKQALAKVAKPVCNTADYALHMIVGFLILAIIFVGLMTYVFGNVH